MKRWLLLLATVALAGTVWIIHAAFVRHRARELRRSADEASRRFEFQAAHALWLAYLEDHATEAEAHLHAARCARRAELLEDYAGPHPELGESFSAHLDAARRLNASPLAVALEETLERVQRGRPSGDERRLLERVRAEEAEAPLILEALVQGNLRRLQFDRALGLVETLLNVQPDHALGFLWRGRIRDQFNPGQSGREDLEQALKINPSFDAARYYLAESLLRSHQVTDAEAHLQVLREKQPDNLLVRLAWAKCRIALGDQSQGQELLDAWLAEAPNKHPRLLEALEARARLALSLGQPSKAEAFARRALQESPLDQHALHNLARSLAAQERHSEAQAVEEQLEKIKQDLRLVTRCRDELARNPDEVSLRHEIGAAYLRLGRPGEALVWLNSALERDPKHKPTLQTLADFHARAGKESVAAELRRRAADP